MLFPIKTKYKKQFKGKIKGKTFRSNNIIFGDFAIKSLEEGRISSRHIESARKNIVRKMKRSGSVWIRIYPDTPVSVKPNEIRMGKGKGPVNYWVSKVKKGQVIFEISGISEKDAMKFLVTSGKKLPVKIKFIKKYI